MYLCGENLRRLFDKEIGIKVQKTLRACLSALLRCRSKLWRVRLDYAWRYCIARLRECNYSMTRYKYMRGTSRAATTGSQVELLLNLPTQNTDERLPKFTVTLTRSLKWISKLTEGLVILCSSWWCACSMIYWWMLAIYGMSVSVTSADASSRIPMATDSPPLKTGCSF